MSAFKQAKRLDTDGSVELRRTDDGLLELVVVTDCTTSRAVMSEYNASRAYAFLALMLGIPIPKAVSKAIELGEPEAIVRSKRAPKNLGERLVAMAKFDALNEKLKATGFRIERTTPPSSEQRETK